MAKLLVIVLLALATAFTSGCSSKKENDVPNTLYVATPQKIQGLDPIHASDLYSNEEVGKVYEGLLQYAYLKRPYTLEPALAEAMPTLSKDGLTYTFKIKKGVLFQDDPAFKATNGKGRELTAEDFIYSWKRLADPKQASAGFWIFDGRIKGMNEWRDAATKAGTTDFSKPIEGLKALDPYTLQITMTKKTGIFLYGLQMGFSSVVAHEAVEHYGKEFLNHPVGTGPFRLAEYTPGSKFVWVKNPTFRKELYPSEGSAADKALGLLEEAGKPLPRADRIITQVFEETQPMWLSFLAGKLDISAIPKDNFAQAIGANKEPIPELAQKGIRAVKEIQIEITHTSFNMQDPLFGKNKLLRQALSLAYDERQYIELFYAGQAIPAQGPIPPGLTGYDEKLINPYRQFNLAKAKELLAQAGFPEGKGLPEIQYLTLADSTSRQSSEYVQKQFAALGVKMKINTHSWPEFLAKIKSRQGQMYSYAWGADYPDAENFLQLFYSKNASPGPNDANYMNPEFDRLYEQSLSMTDTPARTAIYKKAAAIVMEDCPWIFNVQRMKFNLYHPWVKGYKPHQIEQNRYKYVSVDPARRTK